MSLLTSWKIQGGNSPVENDVIRTGLGPCVPETDGLVKVSADYRRTGAVHGHEVVAARSGEFRFYT